jgi:hypothetical protein
MPLIALQGSVFDIHYSTFNEDYRRDPDKSHSCECDPRSSAPKGFLFRLFIKASFQQAQNKNPSASGTGIVFDVGHTGFERNKKYSV